LPDAPEFRAASVFGPHLAAELNPEAKALRHMDPNPLSHTLFDAPAGIGWSETDKVESVPGAQERRARHRLETATVAHLIQKNFLNDYGYLGLKGLVLRGNCDLTHPDRAI